MIADLKPYSEYTDSGLTWLGQVPEHWEVKPLRTMLKLRNEKNNPIKTTQILSLSIARGVTLYSHEGRGGNRSKGDLSAYKIARVGDIVLNSMNVIVGAVGLSRYTGAISPVYYALYPRAESTDIHYFDSLFSNSVFQRYLLIYGKGILIKESDSGKLNTIRMKISPDDLKTTLLPLPPPEEQAAIVRFLDWANGRLERTIRAKRKVIALLNEQKQAIIHRAVTRGLDPNVPLKPSGVPWLGDIPAHWEVRRAKFLFREVDERSETGRETHLAMSQKLGLVPSDMVQSTLRSDSYAGAKLCEVGDLVLNRLKAHLGVFAMAKLHGVISPDYSVFRQRVKIDMSYYESLLKSSACRTELRIRAKGIVEGFWRLYTDDFYDIRLPVPPLEEQSKVMDSVAEMTFGINTTISRLEREIELLREYRTRLVADVVTGKLDVRVAAAQLPEEVTSELAEDDVELDDALETADEEAEA